mgnify:CR=1 FL=1|jgi:ABC-type lipoprotein export system ATPase subunit
MPAANILLPLCAMNSRPFSPPLLQVFDLHKSFTIGNRRLDILKNISFSVKAGDFVSLQGASGAGKSTLLNLIGMLDRPDAGSILIEGKQTRQMSDHDLARIRNHKIGFVFQSYHLLPEFDALENISMPARIARRPHAEVRERAVKLLEQVGLAGRADHRPSELSGGEQQRVAIARSLINNPSLLIADEPTGNLDSKTGREILDLLLRLRSERSCTLIIATHDSEIAAQANQTFHIVDGSLKD